MPIEDHVIHLENGLLHGDTPRSKVDQILASALAANDPPVMVVHFHGGLVKYEAGMQTAKRLAPIYSSAGAYPVFFVWESGLVESIVNNLGEITDEKIFQIIWKRVRKIIARKLEKAVGSRGAPGLPQASDAEDLDAQIDRFVQDHEFAPLLEDEIDSDTELTELTSAEVTLLEAEMAFDLELSREIQRISNGLRDQDDVGEELVSRNATVRGSTETLMDPAALDRYVEGRSPQSRGLISAIKLVKAIIMVAGRVIGRYISDRDHGLHATIIEEILHEFYLANVGGIIWRTMKQDTADSFGDDAGMHGGSAFLDALAQLADTRSPPRIVLVGHSTGAVYISHFLAKADAVLPPEIVFDVVYLAPASTFQLTERTFANHHRRISGFRMFTMDDDYERADRLVPLLYPHSLLYFVSGVVEAETDMPLVGMARYFDDAIYRSDRFPKVEAVRQYLASGADRIVWAVTSGSDAGKQTTATKHGGFTQDQMTMDSVKHVIEHGF